MNIVLVSTGSALCDALAGQFTMRGRAGHILSQAELLKQTDTALRDVVLIDLQGLEHLDKPGSEADAAEFLAQRRQLAQRCAAGKSPRIAVSDGRVFAPLGRKQDGCSESAKPDADSEFSRQLLTLEQSWLDDPGQSLVLRTGPLIADSGADFLQFVLASLRSGKPLALGTDTRCCPTPTLDLARVLSAMADQLACDAPCEGIYHYQSSGAVSAYEFGEIVYAYASQLLDLRNPDAAALSEQAGADRWQPEVPVLQSSRLLRHFGIKQLPWRAYLPKLIKQRCEETES